MPSSAPGPPPAPILKPHASRQKWTQPKWGMQTMIIKHEKAMPSAKPSHLKVGLHADGISGWHIHARRIHKLFIVDNGDDFTTQMARKLIRWISRSKTERQENSFQLPVRSLSRWRALQMHHAKMRALNEKQKSNWCMTRDYIQLCDRGLMTQKNTINQYVSVSRWHDSQR